MAARSLRHRSAGDPACRRRFHRTTAVFEDAGFIGLPLVDAAVVVRILFGGGNRLAGVVLPPIDLRFVGSRREISMRESSVASGKYPGVRFAVSARDSPTFTSFEWSS